MCGLPLSAFVEACMLSERWGLGMNPEGVWGRGAWWEECEGGSGLRGLELARCYEGKMNGRGLPAGLGLFDQVEILGPWW